MALEFIRKSKYPLVKRGSDKGFDSNVWVHLYFGSPLNFELFCNRCSQRVGKLSFGRILNAGACGSFFRARR
jgi:hypothetical protein